MGREWSVSLPSVVNRTGIQAALFSSVQRAGCRFARKNEWSFAMTSSDFKPSRVDWESFGRCPSTMTDSDPTEKRGYSMKSKPTTERNDHFR